ncbi:MAG: DMT family transporter [Candidatus Binatia bacterium]
MRDDHRRLALLAVAVAVVTWGCSNVLIKGVAVPGLVASFYRLWMSVPLLWAVPLVYPAAMPRFDRRWRWAVSIGGSLFALHQVLFFSALKLTTVANVALIGALQPPLVLMVGRRWFGEPVAPGAVRWSAVALGGLAMVIVGGAGLPGWSPLGDLLALANLFAFTAYFLATKRLRADTGAAEYIIGMTTVAAVIMLVICLASGQPLMAPRGWEWGALLVLALFPGTLGHFLTGWAYPHASAFAVSIMFLAVPVVASVGAAVFLDETLGPLQILGGGVVLAAVAAVVLSQPARARDELAESVVETDAP